MDICIDLSLFIIIIKLEGTAPYGRLLLAPAEGWWPSATWRALWALWIAVLAEITWWELYWQRSLGRNWIGRDHWVGIVLTEITGWELYWQITGWELYWQRSLGGNCAAQWLSDSTLIATQWLLGLATWQQCKKSDKGGGGGKGTSSGLGLWCRLSWPPFLYTLGAGQPVTPGTCTTHCNTQHAPSARVMSWHVIGRLGVMLYSEQWGDSIGHPGVGGGGGEED